MMIKHMMDATIYLTGSRKHVKRTIYTENGKYFVKWYGQYIEVFNIYTNLTIGWVTVEAY